MAFDPYDQLGIARTASAAVVKSAYRQRVQVAHPDRGGDKESFIAIVRAFGLLSDPDARRLFDETGIVDESGVVTYRRDVATILADMFDVAVATAVGSGLRLTSVDFIAQMTIAVKRGLADAKTALAKADREISSLQTLRTRIRRNGEGQNFFAERLDGQIAAKATERAAVKRRQLILDTALVELGNYESEVELIVALEVQ